MQYLKPTSCFQGYDSYSPRKANRLNKRKPLKTKYCAEYLEHISDPHRGKHKETKMERAQERAEKNEPSSSDIAEVWDDFEFWNDDDERWHDNDEFHDDPELYDDTKFYDDDEFSVDTEYGTNNLRLSTPLLWFARCCRTTTGKISTVRG